MSQRYILEVDMNVKMVEVNIAVMDYASCEIRMFNADMPEDYQTKDIEAWLEVHDPNFSDDQCNYMASDKSIEVYDCGDGTDDPDFYELKIW
jgi:hypothetical protein